MGITCNKWQKQINSINFLLKPDISSWGTTWHVLSPKETHGSTPQWYLWYYWSVFHQLAINDLILYDACLICTHSRKWFEPGSYKPWWNYYQQHLSGFDSFTPAINNFHLELYSFWKPLTYQVIDICFWKDKSCYIWISMQQ